jgi:hypothetical protein
MNILQECIQAYLKREENEYSRQHVDDRARDHEHSTMPLVEERPRDYAHGKLKAELNGPDPGLYGVFNFSRQQ